MNLYLTVCHVQQVYSGLDQALELYDGRDCEKNCRVQKLYCGLGQPVGLYRELDREKIFQKLYCKLVMQY